MDSIEIISEARSIGERIRKARKSRNLSQADLARRIGVSQPAIANWESGMHDPRRFTLAKLADVLDAPLDWLAAGGRSDTEADKNPAASYIRRPLRHVPVISLRAAGLLAQDINADPHKMAEDYFPVTLGPSKLFGVFINDSAVNLAFLPDTLVVIDFHDRMPRDGAFCLAHVDQAPMIRRWKANPDRLEPDTNELGHETILMRPDIAIIGCVRVSIRVH